MLLTLLRFLRGYLHIRIVGYSPERFLNLCSHHHIYLWNLAPSSNSYEMNISVSHFRKLKPILKKTNTKIVVLKRHGSCFFFHKYRKRKMFFIGIFLCLGIIYMLSQFVWSVEIEGNYSRTDEVLVKFLESKDVYHGMKKSKISCDKIVKDIRKEYNDIIWVSASIKGARLIIEVKENSDSFVASEAADSAPTDIIAQSEGTITKIITRKGIPQVHVGDTVSKDQLLVSGQIPVKNDSGEISGYQYTKADADIYAKTSIVYENKLPTTYQSKTYSGVEKKLYFMNLGNYRISLGSLKNNYKEYISLMEYKSLHINKNFDLPIGGGYIVYKHYASKEKAYTKMEITKILSSHFQRYCDELEKMGVEIIQNDVKIHIEENIATATGTMELISPLGTEAPSTIVPVEVTKGEEE